MSFLYSWALPHAGRGSPSVRERKWTGRCIIPRQYSAGISGSSQITNPPPQTGTGTVGGGTARLDITALDRTVCQLYRQGLAQSTQRAYASGKRRYLNFCERLGVPPLPTTEGQLCYFVGFLKDQGLRHQTVKSYLSAVRHLQISQGKGDPKMGTMPRLELVIWGLKKEQAGLPKKTRLPITPAILRQIRQKWESHGAEWDYIMLWAVVSLCFLRSGEVVVPSDSSYDPGQHLSFEDIAVDNQANPSCLRVSLKQSKTDPFRNGVKIIIGRAEGPLCPVAAYMALRGPGEGPPFRFQDGRFLTRQQLVAATTASCSWGVRTHSWYATLCHLPIVFVRESWTPQAAAVVAAPMRKLCPAYFSGWRPTSCSTSLSLAYSCWSVLDIPLMDIGVLHIAMCHTCSFGLVWVC